jgi:hypothetical protein
MVPTFIHVGFMNSGTTSLQRNFFSQRPEFFLVGEPYNERGGIFHNIKSVEDYLFDDSGISRLCDEQIYELRKGRSIVISDEALCGDTPQIYFPPFTISRDHIALRLRRFFPNAKIIFTLREQRRYATTMYLCLKRNSAFLDRRVKSAIPPFSRWFRGVLSQPKCHYLNNLDYSEAIGLYVQIFGRENICVLPLEMIAEEGERAYLGKLCEHMNISLSDSDVDRFKVVHNRRMSSRRNMVADLITDDRFESLLDGLAERFGRDEIDAFLEDSPREDITLTADEEQEIRCRVGQGNRLIADEFGLNLEQYGYMIADPNAQDEVKNSVIRARLKASSADSKVMQLGHKLDVSLLRQGLSDRIAQLASAQQQLASAQQQLDDRTAQLASAQQQLASAQQQLDDRTAQLTSAHQQVADMQTEIAQAVARIDGLQHSLENAIESSSAKLAAALADIQTLKRTVSWRLTAPLRAVRRAIPARKSCA